MIGTGVSHAMVLNRGQLRGKFEHMDEPVQLPIDGVLDLHSFKPKEIKSLIVDYLAACQERGIYQVRIIHGKGIGNLRRTVHSILAKHPEVVSFALDHPQYGGWGATLVSLRPSPAAKS
jgi:DNA-nicking Smr family endonuclease